VTTATAEPVAKVRYLAVTPDVAARSLLVPADQMHQLKLTALRKLGIVPEPNEKPLHAWLRVMAAENGLPHTVPAHKALRDCVDSDVGRFVFFLA
jgi:hypothetical protein